MVNKWRTPTLTDVEEIKLAIGMLPIWATMHSHVLDDLYPNVHILDRSPKPPPPWSVTSANLSRLQQLPSTVCAQQSIDRTSLRLDCFANNKKIAQQPPRSNPIATHRRWPSPLNILNGGSCSRRSKAFTRGAITWLGKQSNDDCSSAKCVLVDPTILLCGLWPDVYLQWPARFFP